MRSADRLLYHYQVERELADLLRRSTSSERTRLYSTVYNELFRRVPDHPQLCRTDRAERINVALTLLTPFLDRGFSFLEIGAGDCAISFCVAERVAKVYAVDILDSIPAMTKRPANFELRLSDGCDIPVPPSSIDIAYSNQLIEHLHPEDALSQTKNILKALRPGGFYICITPHRFTGPHDISIYYDSEATGLHLKEYTCTELAELFRDAGFSKVRILAGAHGRFFKTAIGPINVVESSLAILPHLVRKLLVGQLPLRVFMGIRIIGWRNV